MPTKTEKSTTKTAPTSKVFDVAKPGKLAPHATARPIIVNNRPILQDPMVSTATASEEPKTPEADAADSPSLPKITINPLATDEGTAGSSAKGTDVAVKTAADEPSYKITTKKTEAKADPTPEGPVVDAKVEEPPIEEVAAIEVPADAEKPAETSQDTGTAEPAATPDEPTNPAEKDEAEPASEESEESDEEESSEQADEGKVDKETAELEAIAKHKDEIQKLVDGKEYVLPINAVERHRSKIAALLGLILIVVLGLLLVNLLLEFGFLRIGGLKPVVTFFK